MYICQLLVSRCVVHLFWRKMWNRFCSENTLLFNFNFGKNALKASEPNKQTGYFMLYWLIFILCASNSDVSSRLSVRLT